jgi:hypothetical protein
MGTEKEDDDEYQNPDRLGISILGGGIRTPFLCPGTRQLVPDVEPAAILVVDEMKRALNLLKQTVVALTTAGGNTQRLPG